MSTQVQAVTPKITNGNIKGNDHKGNDHEGQSLAHGIMSAIGLAHSQSGSSAASYNGSSSASHSVSASSAAAHSEYSATSYSSSSTFSSNETSNYKSTITLTEEQKRILHQSTSCFGSALSQVPWMKFRVVAEPNMDIFTSDERLQMFIREITALTVSIVTEQVNKEMKAVVTKLVTAMTNSTASKVSLIQETIIKEMSSLLLQETITAHQNLSMVEQPVCFGTKGDHHHHCHDHHHDHHHHDHDHGHHGPHHHDVHYGAAVKHDITKAKWIWTKEIVNKKPGQPFGARPFRKVIKTASIVDRLTIDIGCDDKYTLYVNGHLVGCGEEWHTPDRYIVEFEPTREVVVAVYASEDNGGSETGLISAGRAWYSRDEHAHGVTFVTDETWKTHSGNTIDKKFFTTEYKDNNWEACTLLKNFEGGSRAKEMKAPQKARMTYQRWTGKSVPDAPEAPKARVL